MKNNKKGRQNYYLLITKKSLYNLQKPSNYNISHKYK